jgi:hypothetical protein
MTEWDNMYQQWVEWYKVFCMLCQKAWKVNK